MDLAPTHHTLLAMATSLRVLGFGSFVFTWMLSTSRWESGVAWKDHLQWVPPVLAHGGGSADLLLTVAFW